MKKIGKFFSNFSKRFFEHLGKVFSFVIAELTDKFKNVEECILKDGNRNNYRTITSAVEYEKKNGIHLLNQNATLSVLRLLRGLDFIRKLLDYIFHNQDSHKKTHELAVQAYDETLAFRHKWSVRQLVKGGLFILPKKKDLLKIMFIGSDPNNTRKENDRLYKEFLNLLDRVFSIIHNIYDENNFLELVLA